HSEDYVHRIGRTGRAGRSGKSITLCLPQDEKYLAKIEELVKKAIPVRESPLAAGEPGFEPTPARAATGDRRRTERGSRSRPRTTAPAPAVAAEVAVATAPAPEAAEEAVGTAAPEPRYERDRGERTGRRDGDRDRSSRNRGERG